MNTTRVVAPSLARDAIKYRNQEPVEPDIPSESDRR